jgi:SAM-dependent methyltransferase
MLMKAGDKVIPGGFSAVPGKSEIGKDNESGVWEPRVQVPADYYISGYDDYDHWIRHYWVIRNVLDRKCRSLLEIGVGSGVVASYLRNIGVDVTTFDIDSSLKPDYIGSVTELPFQDGSFEAITCCEVLEHMPFEQSEKALAELYRVTSKYVIVTVPRRVLTFALLLRMPVLQMKEFRLRLPIFGLSTIPPNGQHFWELGTNGYSQSRLLRSMSRIGFKVLSTKAQPTNYSSAFFVLEK